jgi:hypothetical protein
MIIPCSKPGGTGNNQRYGIAAITAAVSVDVIAISFPPWNCVSLGMRISFPPGSQEASVFYKTKVSITVIKNYENKWLKHL